MEVDFVCIKIVRKEQVYKRKVYDFCYGFPGPKTFRDLRETGSRVYNRSFTVSGAYGGIYVCAGFRVIYNKNAQLHIDQLSSNCRPSTVT